MKTLEEIKKAFSDGVIHGVFIGDFTTALSLIDKKNGPSFWGSFNDAVISRLFRKSEKPLDSQVPISSIDEFKARIIGWSLGVRFKGVPVLTLIQRNIPLIRDTIYFDEDRNVTPLMFTRGALNRFVFDTMRDAKVN